MRVQANSVTLQKVHTVVRQCCPHRMQSWTFEPLQTQDKNSCYLPKESARLLCSLSGYSDYENGCLRWPDLISTDSLSVKKVVPALSHYVYQFTLPCRVLRRRQFVRTGVPCRNECTTQRLRLRKQAVQLCGPLARGCQQHPVIGSSGQLTSSGGIFFGTSREKGTSVSIKKAGAASSAPTKAKNARRTDRDAESPGCGLGIRPGHSRRFGASTRRGGQARN
jgi:hypothetical protein